VNKYAHTIEPKDYAEAEITAKVKDVMVSLPPLDIVPPPVYIPVPVKLPLKVMQE
jgi:hypothetical protein